MEVTFYKSSNAPNEYPKTFTDAKTKQCTLLEPTSTKSPVIKLEIDSTLKGYTHAVLWGDTYILRDDFQYEKGFMYINCVRSAIDTYWNTVKNCQARITRSQAGDPYIIDGLATQKEGDIVSCRKIGTAFTSGCTYVFIKGVTAQEQESE